MQHRLEVYTTVQRSLLTENMQQSNSQTRLLAVCATPPPPFPICFHTAVCYYIAYEITAMWIHATHDPTHSQKSLVIITYKRSLQVSVVKDPTVVSLFHCGWCVQRLDTLCFVGKQAPSWHCTNGVRAKSSRFLNNLTFSSVCFFVALHEFFYSRRCRGYKVLHPVR